jgi:hypothetical protein
MNIGIYLRNIRKWDEIGPQIGRRVNWVVCGDYGCAMALPAVNDLIDLGRVLNQAKLKLHYISPKVSTQVIGPESDRVLALLDEGISVSINDWGLLYRLRPQLKPEAQVYLGRLLSKNILDWAWASVFLAKEEPAAIDYLAQNNLNHQVKLNFLKAWGIKGVEVSVYSESERSFRKITENGLAVMGYPDKSILAVSRTCPLARINGYDISVNHCKRWCYEGDCQVIPSKEKQQEMYPRIEMCGNILYRPLNVQPKGEFYQALIYTWTPALTDEWDRLFGKESEGNG